MYSKKHILPLINEPSLVSPSPSAEPGAEAQPASEISSQNAQKNSSGNELEALDDEIDPFAHRHLPTSVEALPIEQEDIERAFSQADTHILSSAAPPTSPAKPHRPPRWPFSRLKVRRSDRKFFVFLALLIVVLSIGYGSLFLFNTSRPHSSPSPTATPSHSTLSVTPAQTHPGEAVTLHLSGFSPFAQVRLTRDMQQPVRTDAGAPLIKLGSDGHADVGVLVQDNWRAGTHLLLAEDIRTHFTASASLQVISDFPTPLPGLTVGSQDQPNGLNSPLNFGADIPEVNTIQSLLLRNTGGSWISWQATSDQPWLTLAPRQGVFQDSQGVFVAAERFRLAPGYHQCTITFTSNAGTVVVVQAEVTVLAPPKTTSALLQIEPPLLSFTATDGAGNPTAQSLTISNPGSGPLNWSLTTSAPQDSFTQTMNSQNDYSWLRTDDTSGVVAPGASARIQVMPQSRQLLPGVYGAILLFNINGDPLVALQPVAVSLTVQPRCGVISNPTSVSITVAAGRQTPFDQPLSIGTTPGCADATNWQVFPQADWLKMTPTSGQLQPGAIVKGTLEFDASSLVPGTYTASVDLLTEMRSQTLVARLTVLSPTATPGGTPVGVTPTSTVAPVTPTPLPQSCTLQVTPTSLSFTATFFQTSPPPQTLTLNVTGNCSQHVTWAASVDAASQSWLHLTPTSGDIKAGGATLVVQANAHHKKLGVYSGQITLTALAHSSAPIQASPQTVPVTLTVVF